MEINLLLNEKKKRKKNVITYSYVKGNLISGRDQ